jgi:hypothetical protein
MNFTDNEKAICLISGFVSNPMTQGVPSETLALGLQQMLLARNIDYTLQKISEMIMLIKEEHKVFIKDGFGKLKNMGKGFP